MATVQHRHYFNTARNVHLNMRFVDVLVNYHSSAIDHNLNTINVPRKY